MHEQQPEPETIGRGQLGEPKSPEQQAAPPRLSPSIYIASLADYNNGILHGEWIDAARDAEAVYADITAMLARSKEPGAEEWAIHDFDQFGRWRVGEYDGIERVTRIARGIAEHGEAFSAWVGLMDGDEDRYDAFSQAYLGHFDSAEDYVERMADDLGYNDELAMLPAALQPYVRFDCQALAHNLQLSGDIDTVEDPSGGVWIFRIDE